jgi:hypothetical protein
MDAVVIDMIQWWLCHVLQAADAADRPRIKLRYRGVMRHRILFNAPIFMENEGVVLEDKEKG